MNHLMWSNRPAGEYMEGYPLGNGTLGLMMLGTAPEERIGLNHEWLWRGDHRDRDVIEAHMHLAEIRRLFFAGELEEASRLANLWFGGGGGTSGVRGRVDPYQPAGDLRIAFDHDGEVKDYIRRLDLAKAVASVAYAAGGVTYTREAFACADRSGAWLRLTASKPGALGCTIGLDRIEDPQAALWKEATGREAVLHGAFHSGVAWAVAIRADLVGEGTVAPVEGEAALRIAGATEAVVRLGVAVELDGADPRPAARKQLGRKKADWDRARRRREKAHALLYDRVRIDLGGEDDPDADLPTDARIAAAREGRIGNGLVELYFNVGRYLLIACAKPGGLPPNLQGLWNEHLDPAWQCDLHQDINLQMAYWPAEPCGLAECAEPLFDHVERFVPHGKRAAKRLYGCRGVWLPLQTDPWGRATPESRGWAVWVGAAAWLAMQFRERWAYGRDRAFLRERAYPYYKQVARFFEDYLVRDAEGRLVPVPSQSPENAFVGGTKPVSLCVGATSDIELIDAVLAAAVEASEALGVDASRRKRWKKMRADLPPLGVGRHGQLREWLEDYEEAEPAHRHISHLIALYPGDAITLEETPELAAAARTSLDRRLAEGGGHTGWSRAWTVCCRARLAEGDEALEHLRHLIADFATDSLLDLHPPRIFQIDGNFGGAAGVVEMLMQSHGEVIRLLPALPAAWPRGMARGLRARGGFAVDFAWEDGRVRSCSVQSLRGRRCAVRIPEGEAPPTVHAGKARAKATVKDGVLRFRTRKGETYRLDWSGAV